MNFHLRTCVDGCITMQQTEPQDKEREILLSKIVPIMLERGLKSTTMDVVASELGISKRTLYEKFGSKSEMISDCLAALGRQHQQQINEAFSSSSNVMEAFIKVFKYNRDLMQNVNVEFYRDMDRLYHGNREDYNKTRESHQERMHQMFKLGVEQGMFRPDVDYSVQSKIVGLQMEALKRIEELFPPDITLQRLFDAIMVGFLRSIASEKGMVILDRLTDELKNRKQKQQE